MEQGEQDELTRTKGSTATNIHKAVIRCRLNFGGHLPETVWDRVNDLNVFNLLSWEAGLHLIGEIS